MKDKTNYDFEGESEKDAVEKAVKELSLASREFDVEILEEKKKTFFTKGYVKIRIHLNEENQNDEKVFEDEKENEEAKEENEEEITRKILSFLETVIEKMGIVAKVRAEKKEEKKLLLKLSSEDSSLLIGRKGKTLDALQLITNLYADKVSARTWRVVVDAENYRLRREEEIVRMAFESARKVRASHKAVLLEPMNPFERRLIHKTLNDMASVTTESEGKGNFKRVRIMYTGV